MTGIVTTIAGNGDYGSTDGVGSLATFGAPTGIALDEEGNLFVTDHDHDFFAGGDRIRKITKQGVVSTVAGSSRGFADGVGTNAKFNYPAGIILDTNKNMFVAERGNYRVRKITPQGVVSTVAGKYSAGCVDGARNSAQLGNCEGIAIDKEGHLYVADEGNHKIRKITAQGNVSTIAGSSGGYADGVGTNALFNRPTAITMDNAGNLLVVDSGNYRIRQVTPQGVVTTIVGSCKGNVDGEWSKAQFSNPRGIALDSEGNIIVADCDNHSIRKIS